jgi:hypothetical protein
VDGSLVEVRSEVLIVVSEKLTFGRFVLLCHFPFHSDGRRLRLIARFGPRGGPKDFSKDEHRKWNKGKKGKTLEDAKLDDVLGPR